MPAPDQFRPAPAVPPTSLSSRPGPVHVYPETSPDPAPTADVSPRAVLLTRRDGNPLYVNPAFVVSLAPATSLYAGDVTYDGQPLTELQLAFVSNGWLVRGDADSIAERLWP